MPKTAWKDRAICATAMEKLSLPDSYRIALTTRMLFIAYIAENNNTKLNEQFKNPINLTLQLLFPEFILRIPTDTIPAF